MLIFLLFLLPREFPEAWKNKTLKVPVWLYYGFRVLALAAQTVTTYTSLKTVDSSTAVFTVVYVMGCIVATAILSKKDTVKTSGLFYDDDDNEIIAVSKR